jgi:DNA repair exonuclease SbcCD ATPase subunit
MKKFGVALTVISIFLLIAVVYAQGQGMTGKEQGWNFCPYCGGYIGPRGVYGMGPGMMGGYGMHHGSMGGYIKSEECQKFLDDTSKERKELNDKKFKYYEAHRNPKTSSETKVKLEKEIRDLQEQIYSKAPQSCWWQ